MLGELISALLIGILVGTFTGLSPGIHINLVATFLLASLDKFSSTTPLSLAIFIVSMSVTHTIIDFIPSIYLGAPEEDTFLSVLPGHQLLQEGRGHEAVALASLGALTAVPILLVITPLFVFALPSIYSLISISIPFILIFASLYLIFREKYFWTALVVFLLSGILGYLSFNLPVKEPLLPLLTGLFGLSSLIISIKQSSKISTQKITSLKEVKLTRKELSTSFFSASVVSPLCSFLPGIGSSHAAFLSSEMINQNNRIFLFVMGAINLLVMSLSFVTVYAIGKARTGSAAAVKTLIPEIHLSNLIIITLAIIITAAIAFILSINLSKAVSKVVNKINYPLLNLITIIFLLIVIIIFSNWLGAIVLITSTSLGIFTSSSEIKRINLMGCLILPSIVYLLG